MKKRQNRFLAVLLIAGALAAFGWMISAFSAETDGARHGVLVEFFHEAGCRQCEEVRGLLRPMLTERYGADVVWLERDIGVESNFLALAAYQERAGGMTEGPVTVVLNRRDVFVGDGQKLITAVCEAVRRTLELREEETVRVAEPPPITEGVAALDRRRAQMTWGSVAAAGLVDSVNPCAVGTLVFLASALGAVRLSGRRWLVTGAAYVAAVFLTYLGLGFGLFRFVRLWWGMRRLQMMFNVIMTIMLLMLAWLSFRDAWRFAQTRGAASVTVRLPESVTRGLHGLIRRGVLERWCVPVAVGLGIFVPLVEAACTGQVYFPTLVFLVKSDISPGWALAYLLVYNVLFILPLVAVLALTCLGLGARPLVEWSRRNVVWSKVLMGVFFLGLTALYVW